ncbi:EAL domain-containing protein [Mariprofundus erugo]|uniref:EAL domain-containing protein n=1 Tax=Mariprofundus erugo TaxID=2528639 RepID=A0A5R9GSY9_9PROT|nr:EAL domain-containing protein [Mariprofundus erugo]
MNQQSKRCTDDTTKHVAAIDTGTNDHADHRGADLTAHILIIDDSERNRTLLARLLDALGYITTTAEGGTAALALMERHTYDLILLDMVMPEVDGLTTLQLIRRRYQINELPVIMVTGMSEVASVTRALELGANDYISKPFQKDILLSRVRMQLEMCRLYKDVKTSEERYSLAFSAANDGLWDWNIVTGKVFFSDQWHEMMGISPACYLDSIDDWFDRVHPDDITALRQAVEAHLQDAHCIVKQEYRALHADGNYRWMMCRARVLFSDTGKPLRMTGAQADISASKTFDPITRLPNAAVFMDRLRRVHAHACRTGINIRLALFSLSLNHKEKVTSALGPAGYEKLTSAIAQRLNKLTSTGDFLTQLKEPAFISLLADNRFMILLEGIPGEHAELLKIGRHIQNCLAEPFSIFNETIYCTTSIGIALPAIADTPVDMMIQDAISAESIARQAGENITHIYNPQLHGKAIDHLRLENELRHAISHGELKVFYQPVVSATDGAIAGSESLVRWQHPERGLLAPCHFIPLAESAGLIHAIDLWIFRESCRQYREWILHGGSASMFISVNISVQSLDISWADQILKAVAEFGIPPESIHLEITESVFAGDIEKIIGLLEQLAGLGISFAIDDFGTGYSCFSYLRRLPASCLKIDKAFIDDIVDHEKARALVRSIIHMAHDLGMNIIAEGIENKEQAAILASLGADYMQGYYFGRPLAAEDCDMSAGRRLPG